MYYIKLADKTYTPYKYNPEIPEAEIIVFANKPTDEYIKIAIRKLRYELDKFWKDGVTWYSGILLEGKGEIYEVYKNYIILNEVKEFTSIYLKDATPVNSVSNSIKLKARLYTMYNYVK